MTPIDSACSFKSLAKWLSVDLHVDNTCTKRLPYGASGQMHKSDKGHSSNSSSGRLTDEVVKTVNNRRRGKKEINTSYTAKKAKKRKAQAKESRKRGK